MTKDMRARVLRALANYAQLERKNTDEIGWVALTFSVTRAKAERMIAEAKEVR
jgi:hypothetical protein